MSKCLGFDTCRYDGETVHSEGVNKMNERVNFIPICPEMSIGLGVPRDSIGIYKINGEFRLKQHSTGEDLTAKMRDFAREFFLKLGKIDGFILKSRSPSCGVNDATIYSENGALHNGTGVFTKMVIEKFPGTPLVDEKEIDDKEFRELFLERLVKSTHL